MQEVFEKIIERISKLKTYYKESYSQGFPMDIECVDKEDVIKIINQVEEEYGDKWIPCEEEQPKKYGNYLYTDKNDEVHEGCYAPSNSGLIRGWSTCEADGYVKLSDEDVIAWKPLPEPYHPKETEL